jgi:O-acetyl-ADP-ribose deacetylase (regulator of RNase III)
MRIVPTFLNSITGLPQYEQKSYEELRWEDYLINNKFPKHPPPATQTQTIHINNNSLSTNNIGIAPSNANLIAPAAPSHPSTSASSFQFNFSIQGANFSSIAPIKANPRSVVSTSANNSSNLFDSSSIGANIRSIPSSFKPTTPSTPSSAIFSASLALVASLINQAQATEPKKVLLKAEEKQAQLKDSPIFNYEHYRPRITIEKGSVFECNVDVVVNSINTSLDPNYSLTQAFTKLIGDDFKNQLKNYSSLKYVRNLAIYQFAITTNHFNQSKNIPFGNVLNCCINDFDYTSDLSEIHYKNTILELLKLTEQYKLSSIAIPVIGCSKKNYPPHLVVKWIDEAIKKYMLSYSYISTLETIRIILDKSNPSVVDSFQRYYNEKLSIQNLLPSNHKTLIDEYELIKMNSNSDEYKLISKHFALTMGSATIDKVIKLLCNLSFKAPKLKYCEEALRFCFFCPRNF